LTTDGSIQGYGTFHLESSAQEAVVPLETQNAAAYYLPFDNTNGYVSGVAISNFSTIQAGISVTIRDAATGKVVATDIISLERYSHNSFVLTERYPSLVNIAGTIEFSTLFPGQISVLGLRFNPNKAFTSVPALVAAATAPAAMTTIGTMPHFAAGGGWKTIYTLANLGATAAKAQLNFYSDNGLPASLTLSEPQSGSVSAQTTNQFSTTLAPGTVSIVETDSTSAQSQEGWAQLQSDGNVSGFAVYQYRLLSGTSQEAVVPLEARTAVAYVIPFSNVNGYSDGIAIANTTASSQDVAVTVRDGSTGAVTGTSTISLPAQGHTAFMLASQFSSTAGTSGTVEFRTLTGGAIAVLGLHVNSSSAFTSTPALTRP
jgi:hypothetical protein